LAELDSKTRTAPPLCVLLGIAIPACVFAINVYRAAHQSITADEAFTYDWYIVNPWNWIFIVYSTNNHVLHTLLCRLSVTLLGTSELAMRLPSLLGGLLYLVFVYKLCRYLFRNQWIFLLAVAALTLNPFIMDYLSAARGYGMGLGFFIAALYLALRFFGDEADATPGRRISFATVLLGLASAANLIFLFPAAALAGMLTVLRAADPNAGGWWQRLRWIAARVWLPLALTAGLFLAIPLAHEVSGSLNKYGKDSLRDTTLSLVQRSLFHQYNVYRGDVIPGIVTRWTGVLTDWIVPASMALLLIALAPPCFRWLKVRDPHRLGNLDRAYLVIGGVLALSLGLLVAAHYLIGMLYPLDRTALYLAALLTLAWMLLIEKALALPRLNRTLGMLAGAPVAAAILLFVRGFTTSYYYEWSYDAGTKRIFHLLEKQNGFSSSRRMKLGVDWKLDMSLNFYRHMYRADWMAKVERDPPAEAGGFDYYVLLPEDEKTTRKLGLRVIYLDPISGQELKAPGERTARSTPERD